jgi:large subunit ribosomal protein L17
MRHRKLGRTSSHREALFRNQLQSLVVSERIITTLPKAKELRPIAEKVITRGKHGGVNDRRWALRWLLDRELVKKLFDDIAPRFAERPGGYLRIVKLGPRQGDGAEMAVLELVERESVAAPAETPKEAKAKEPKPKKEGPKKEGKEAAPKKPAKPAKPAKSEGGADKSRKGAPSKGATRQKV